MFGVTARARKVISRVKQGDLLVFYVMKPVNGIVAVYEVISDAFTAKHEIPYWGKRGFPFRIRIKPVPGLRRDENKAIRLSFATGTEAEITPFFKDMSIIKISQEQFKKLEEMFVQKS